MEDFSLIILCKERCHLLPITLDTLKPQQGSFEVLILDGEGSPRVQEIASQYPELKVRVEDVTGHTLSDMMNQGVGLARGKYIQFLEPGDRYISQHGIEHVKTLIKNKPHLIYSHTLDNRGVFLSDFITCKSPWFLKRKLFEMGGFDRSFHYCPAFDILCKLKRDETTQSVSCGRVLIDSEGNFSLPLKESCRILYRHFGAVRAFKWFFYQNRSQIFSKAKTFIRKAFFG